jgi:hypothetical protein
MEKDAIIGTALAVFALGWITFLVLWSRHLINWISRKKLTTAREILKELRRNG